MSSTTATNAVQPTMANQGGPIVLSEAQLKLYTRQVSRRFTRDSLGVAISSSMSITMPWMILPAVFSLRRVYCHGNAFYILTKCNKHLSKRQIIRGVIEGTLIKAGTVALTLGHDDVLLTLNDVLQISPETPPFLEAIAVADQGRVNLSLMDITTGAASEPTEGIQKLLCLETADSLANAGVDGYHAPGGEIASQVWMAGAVQAGVEKISDRILEGPFDAAVD